MKKNLVMLGVLVAIVALTATSGFAKINNGVGSEELIRNHQFRLRFAKNQ